MFDLNFVHESRTHHEECCRQLTQDYQQGQADQDVVLSFLRRAWQRIVRTAAVWGQSLGAGSDEPQVHY